MLNLQIERYRNDLQSSIGRLIIDGNLFISTLEPPVGKVNDRGIQSISEGTYKLVPYFSYKFQCIVPLLTTDLHNLDTLKDDEDISKHCYEIHWGNSHHDTDRCILLGKLDHVDWIVDSKYWFKQFMYGYFLKATTRKSVELLNKYFESLQGKESSEMSNLQWETVSNEDYAREDQDVILTIINSF